jgi:putative glycosyltransferase (TIGR04348 family)
MKIGIITPAPPHSRYGNRVTALRWARILRELGHRVTIAQAYNGEAFDLLVALHAKKSHDAIKRFHRAHPGRPLIVALTGTDLYRDLKQSQHARESLELATKIVVLQPKALDELPEYLHEKTRVIYQSVKLFPLISNLQSPISRFQICVIGHLRDVKDPFRAAMAARLLPASSRICVVHAGGAMNVRMAERARREMAINPRYRWIGEQPHGRVRQLLRRSQLLVHSSRLEGGANVISEAIVAGTPVIASRIPGNVGLLGEEYAGYFDTGDATCLARLLARAEVSSAFRAELRAQCEKRQPLFAPAFERQRWVELLAEATG